jgi:hypothetical protein
MTQKNEITPSTNPDLPVYQDMDKRDENQIIQEMRGEILEDLVYDISISGRRVTNLSYAGIKEAIRRRGSLEILDVKTEETESTIRVMVKVRDLQNRIDVLGASEADKTKPFAYTLAVNKAERNAFAKLIPAKWFATLIDEYLQQKGNQPRRDTPQQRPPTQPQQPSTPPVKMQGNKHLDIEPETLTMLTAMTKIEDERLKQYAFTPDGNNPIGMINVIHEVTAIVPYQANLRMDSNAFTSFLFPKIIDKVCNKHGCEYEVVGTQEGALLYILIKGKLAEEQIKELLTPTRWAFLKAFEATNNQPPT